MTLIKVPSSERLEEIKTMLIMEDKITALMATELLVTIDDLSSKAEGYKNGQLQVQLIADNLFDTVQGYAEQLNQYKSQLEEMTDIVNRLQSVAERAIIERNNLRDQLKELSCE